MESWPTCCSVGHTVSGQVEACLAEQLRFPADPLIQKPGFKDDVPCVGGGGGGLLKFRANTAFKINVFRLCSWQIELLKFLRLAFPLEELHVTLLAETEESQCLGKAPPLPTLWPLPHQPDSAHRTQGRMGGGEGSTGHS